MYNETTSHYYCQSAAAGAAGEGGIGGLRTGCPGAASSSRCWVKGVSHPSNPPGGEGR